MDDFWLHELYHTHTWWKIPFTLNFIHTAAIRSVLHDIFHTAAAKKAVARACMQKHEKAEQKDGQPNARSRVLQVCGLNWPHALIEASHTYQSLHASRWYTTCCLPHDIIIVLRLKKLWRVCVSNHIVRVRLLTVTERARKRKKCEGLSPLG